MALKRILAVLGLVLLVGIVSSARVNARAAALPAGFTRELMAQGLIHPTAFAFTADGILVAQLGGVIQVVQNDGSLRAQPYATLNVSTEIERGLVGLALHPKYPTKPYVYVYYTTGPGALNYGGTPVNRVSRFRTVNGFRDERRNFARQYPVAHRRAQWRRFAIWRGWQIIRLCWRRQCGFGDAGAGAAKSIR